MERAIRTELETDDFGTDIRTDKPVIGPHAFGRILNRIIALAFSEAELIPLSCEKELMRFLPSGPWAFGRHCATAARVR
jgi:hypothetical protein